MATAEAYSLALALTDRVLWLRSLRARQEEGAGVRR